MVRLLRRLILLGAIAAIAVALWKRFAQGPHRSTPGAPITYTPLPDAPAAAAAPTPAATGGSAGGSFSLVSSAPASAGSADPATPAWVPPVNGACPDGYPVKAKASTRIFHLPGGRFYDRTTPDRCYVDADAALADGYRQAKA